MGILAKDINYSDRVLFMVPGIHLELRINLES